MKRISQNKFASSLFSCLGVAACVAFSSCGKKDNDKFQSENEFAEFLKSKAQNEQVTFKSDDLTKFANANWKTASKKTFKFTEAIKKQIAGEDSDNENEELNPDQEQQNPDPEQQNQEQQNTEQPNPKQKNPAQQNPGTEQPKPSTADPATTTTISDESKLLSKLTKTEDGKHAGIKVDDICFDLNVFFKIYSWFETHKGSSSQNLISSKELKLDEAINMLKKCKKEVCEVFGNGTAKQVVDVNFVKQEDCKDWENNTVYYFSAGDIQLDTYNNLLYLLLNGKNLGFSDKNLSGQENIGDSVSMKDAYEALVSLQNS